ncbi:hypothetical protein [Pseudaquabacterium pictum]|uniref:Uncharacterized protein n=1 Tax=Pseudaquabacterium pictum TaxID=2315236 RepID=A0A480AMC3_9BURK|nr:hypothetical protein [Rubrivivax pictus]GCL61517.1 hypothetical protein AQPW35_05980 [Rubrivivax pictus]
MTTDCTTTAPALIGGAAAAADNLPGFAERGSPGRMAVLQLLAQHPAGVRTSVVRAVMRRADPRIFDEERARYVLQRLRAAGLASTERDAELQLVWFSPGVRRTQQLRGGWQPDTSPATGPTTAAD